MLKNNPEANITGKLKLYITDDNEFAPSFDKSFYKRLVSCDIGIGYSVLEFTLKDEDATADFELRVQTPSMYVDAVTNSGVGALVLKTRPASPSKGEPLQVFLKLVLSDGGVPEKTSEAYVLLIIPWCSEIITLPASTPGDTDITSDSASVPGVTSDDDESKGTSRDKDVTWETTEKDRVTDSLTSVTVDLTSRRPRVSVMTSMATPVNAVIQQIIVDEAGAWVVRVLCIILFLGYVVLIGLFVKKKLFLQLGRVEPQPNQPEGNNTNENPTAPDTSSQIVAQTNYQDEAPPDPMVLPPYSGPAYDQMSPVPPVSIAAPLAPPTTMSGSLTPMPSLLPEPTNSTPPLCTASQAPPKYLPPIHLDQGPKPPEL
ncbi:uncharacterized protein LOC121366563 [Gigantopelta aegis]|uniref:uncharacterized protein LOC121366563 n=1 Tax=Gigantopelta aegis TaxID=1735272 RepID=UPI001B88D6A4|nr:uncharacterized protein LOC121366563 [Gigantopelta aegis]